MFCRALPLGQPLSLQIIKSLWAHSTLEPPSAIALPTVDSAHAFEVLDVPIYGM